jgi:basic amino acid/polyamine antiporter, APA family
MAAPALIRGLGLWAATAVVVGLIVGQSVFLVANDIAREVGSGSRVLLVWAIGGFIVLLGSSCYAELGAAMPEAGGDYVYLSRGLHPLAGFLYGWTSAMITRPGSAAIIGAGVVRLAAFFFSSLGNPSVARLVAAIVVATAMVLNYLGVRAVGRFQIVVTALKIAALLIMVILGLAFPNSASVMAESARPAGGLVPSVLTALVPVMLAYNGFQLLGNLGGEIRDPGRTVPRSAIAGTFLTVLLYLLVHWVYFRVLGFSAVAGSQHVAADAVAELAGASGARLLTLAMILSAFGAMHAGFLAGSRVSYAMACEGRFFRFASCIHPTFRSPSGAITFQGCMAILLVVTGTYQELYSYAMFATWIFFALTSAALIRLRLKRPELPRPYRMWGYPWTTMIFGTAAVLITLNLWLAQPGRSSLGLDIILLGIPFFYHWNRASGGQIVWSSIEV